ncbi:MAG TPA: hypothetical protein VF719_00750 [Abditibacteriaceae bacterium]
MSYESSDAPGEERGPLPDNLVLVRKTRDFSVEIKPPGAEQNRNISTGLQSPRWNEQLEAAQSLLNANSKDPRLDKFATHPYTELRLIAAQAMLKRGTFTPAVKALLYDPQLGLLVASELSGIREQSRAGGNDAALAVLARGLVQAEAAAKGYASMAWFSGATFTLGSLNDARLGDLMAARLQGPDEMAGGINSGYILMNMAGVRETVKSVDAPLEPAVKERVLAAWKTKRAKVKGLYSPAQLQAELALARKTGFDDFKVGPHFARIVHILDVQAKGYFDTTEATKTVDAELEAMPKEAALDLIRALQWRMGFSYNQRISRSVLNFLARSGEPKAFVTLAAIAYGERGPEAEVRLEAVRLMAQMDWARAQTHIEGFFARPDGKWGWRSDAPRMGAALALAARGEKRAVPLIFNHEKFRTLRHDKIAPALQAATGREFPNTTQWQNWWKREGSALEWK